MGLSVNLDFIERADNRTAVVGQQRLQAQPRRLPDRVPDGRGRTESSTMPEVAPTAGHALSLAKLAKVLRPLHRYRSERCAAGTRKPCQVDVGLRFPERRFGLDDVRTAQQKLRGQTRRHCRHREIAKRPCPSISNSQTDSPTISASDARALRTSSSSVRSALAWRRTTIRWRRPWLANAAPTSTRARTIRSIALAWARFCRAVAMRSRSSRMRK